MKTNKKLRMPRPLGITQAMAQFHKNPSPEKLRSIQSLMIQQWIIGNGLICGQSLNLIQLADFLNCPAEVIRLQMRDQFLSTRLWDKEKQDELLNSLIGQQIIWAMEDRMEVEQQVGILKRSQGGRYAPFVTSELNKAIGMKLSASSGLASVIRSLSGGGSINIFNNQQQVQNNVGLSMQEALEVIQNENAKLMAPEENEGQYSKELKYIEAHHKDLGDIPEVVATEQRGIDTSKEGLNLGQSELNQIADNYKGAIEAFENEHHEMRREIAMNIDPDEKDPEIILPA